MPEEDVARVWERIREAPRDLGPRRELAALLTVRGDPLGEFITLCLREPAAGRRERAEALFDANKNHWFADASLLGWYSCDGSGVPDSLAVIGARSNATAKIDAFVAHYPVRTLTVALTDPAESLACMQARGLLHHVETLRLDECTFSRASIDACARAAPGLLSLSISKPSGLDAAMWRALIESPLVAELGELVIAKADFGAEVLEALWANLPRLHTLRLYECAVPGKSVLAPLPKRRRLKHLMTESGLDEEHVTELLRGLDTRELENLELRRLYLSESAIRVLANKMALGDLPLLRALDLAQNSIGDDLVPLLTAHPPTALESMKLNENLIGEEGMTALAKSPLAARLKTLGIAGNAIGSGRYRDLYAYGVGEPSGQVEENLSIAELAERFGFPKSLQLV